jgi:hypothetical protein
MFHSDILVFHSSALVKALRPAKEFEALFAQAGLRMTRVVPTKSPFSLLEARPA